MGVRDFYVLGLIFLRLGDRESYVLWVNFADDLGLVFLRLGVRDSYVWGLVFSYVWGIGILTFRG